jgi:hypothetical protein
MNVEKNPVEREQRLGPVTLSAQTGQDEVGRVLAFAPGWAFRERLSEDDKTGWIRLSRQSVKSRKCPQKSCACVDSELATLQDAHADLSDIQVRGHPVIEPRLVSLAA